MSMVWTAEAEARLFAVYIRCVDASGKVDYNQMAKFMGPNCTAKAITHRITKVKKAATELSEDWDGGA